MGCFGGAVRSKPFSLRFRQGIVAKSIFLDKPRAFPAPPRILRAFRNGAGRLTWKPVEKPRLRRIRAGSAGQAAWRFALPNPNPCPRTPEPATASLPLLLFRGSPHSGPSAGPPPDFGALSPARERILGNPGPPAPSLASRFLQASPRPSCALGGPSAAPGESPPPGEPDQKASSDGHSPASKDKPG